MTRSSVLVLLTAAALVMAPPCAAQGGDDARVPITVTFSTGAIRRDAALISAGGQLTHRLIELGLDKAVPSISKRGRKGVAVRAAQLWLVSLPVATLSHVLSHEFGHVEYLRRAGSGWDIEISPWPWPFPVTGASVTGRIPVSQVMPLVAGGSEAAFVHETLVADRMHAGGGAHYFDALQFIYVKLDTIVYSLIDLRSSLFADERAFFDTFDLGDPRRFVLEFEQQRRPGHLPAFEAIRDRAGSIRARAATSLLDLTLAGAFINSVRYVKTGERRAKLLSIPAGPFELIPALHFTFTPAGYEHRASMRAISDRGQAQAYVRRITSPVDDHLTGAGGRWSWRPTASGTLRANVKGDVWRTPSDGYGFALELGGERGIRAGAIPLHAGASIGYKTRGILEGYSPNSGLLLNVSGGFRFAP